VESENKKVDIAIRAAKPEEWDEVMHLVWSVFKEFHAEDYGKEGTDSFLEFITDEPLRQHFLCGKYPVFVALCRDSESEEEEIVGMISMRENNFISLLFVKTGMQCSGIGTMLVERAIEFLNPDGEDARLDKDKSEDFRYNRLDDGSVTVNAAPNAVGFYKKLGFVATDGMQVNCGVTYLPMKKNGTVDSMDNLLAGLRALLG
jgi:GNAT superfamily N-acetyltransferase